MSPDHLVAGDYALAFTPWRSWEVWSVVCCGRHAVVSGTVQCASESDAHALSGSCLDIERRVLEVGSGRPYPDWESLRARASDSAEVITWDEVAGALARHPRIGERANGEPGDVALSASEQAGVVSSDVAALAAGNAAYEDRFGYVYLICATGLSGEQMLAALHERLTHDDQAERLVVMDELRRIAALRLAKAISR